MATISIKNQSEYYIDIGTQGVHNMTSWQVSKDSYFYKIIDESLEDHINVTSWKTPLPKLPEDRVDPNVEEFYSNMESLYVRVKIHVGDIIKNINGDVVKKVVKASSDWVVIGPIDQRKQEITVTKNGEYVKTTTTEELGWLD